MLLHCILNEIIIELNGTNVVFDQTLKDKHTCTILNLFKYICCKK